METNTPFSPKEADLLEAIRRTERATADPPGLDIEALVSRAVDAYWTGRAETTEQRRSTDVVGVATLARYVASKMRNAKLEFFLDALVVIVPILLAMLLPAVLLRGGTLFLPSWSVYLVGALIMIVAGWLAVSVLRGRPKGNKWVLLSHSVGALAGALVMAALVGLSNFHVTERADKLQLLVTKDRLIDAVINSLENRRRTGKFLEISSLGSGTEERAVSLRTANILDDNAVYEADARGLPGRLVADVNDDSGTLYWDYGKQHRIQAKFAVGKVTKVYDGGFSLEDLSGNSTLIMTDKGTIGPHPSVDSVVIVELDSNGTTASVVNEVYQVDANRSESRGKRKAHN